ncbi:MAG: non-canonical purine NTP pyrophosphatase [Treponema sp.]|nr:non-canonical purine NTP pyrophosphatase [Treponema sp.]
MTIWFATGNMHKKAELAAILAENGCAGFSLLTPPDAALAFAPEETEDTFHGNALLKARALRDLLRAARPAAYTEDDPIIADDSGICLDALGGRPGIFSARYCGAGCAPGEKSLDDGERNALLLAELGDNPERSARFVCALALLLGEHRFCVCQETFEGEIVCDAGLARGRGGFGYDPILFIPSLGRTVAELSQSEKNALSHRAKAGKRAAQIIAREYGAFSKV